MISSTRITSSTLIIALIFSLTVFTQARVDLGGGHMGLAMVNTCHDRNTISCTELDDDWPDMGLACPEAHHDIPRHTLAMMSATMIQIGRYKTVKKQDFPIDQCYTSVPNSTVSNYGFISQGTFDMWFFAHDKCQCAPKQMPVCNDRATEDDKCNLRTFTLCKVTKKTEICKPKHHDGWKPLPIITEDEDTHPSQKELADEMVSVTAPAFDPATHRKQTLFGDVTGPWWRLMEILGVWGAI